MARTKTWWIAVVWLRQKIRTWQLLAKRKNCMANRVLQTHTHTHTYTSLTKPPPVNQQNSLPKSISTTLRLLLVNTGWDFKTTSLSTKTSVWTYATELNWSLVQLVPVNCTPTYEYRIYCLLLCKYICIRIIMQNKTASVQSHATLHSQLNFHCNFYYVI